MKRLIATIAILLATLVVAQPETSSTNDSIVSFMPKTHEGILLVDYRAEVDGIREPAVFNRGTSPDQTVKVKGEPVAMANGKLQVVVYTRSSPQDKWVQLTTLQIGPNNNNEIVLYEKMKIVYGAK